MSHQYRKKPVVIEAFQFTRRNNGPVGQPSTNIAQNIGIDLKWKGTYLPANKEARAQVLRERIESQQSLTFWDRKAAPIQETLALFE